MISDKVNMSFSELLKSSKNKTEIIVTFLAVLELVKQRSVAVVQENVFDDISIQKIDTENVDVAEERM
jgi:segregation and condensation protein A